MNFFDSIKNEDLTPNTQSSKVKALDSNIYRGVIKGLYLDSFATSKGEGRKTVILTDLEIDGVTVPKQLEVMTNLGTSVYKENVIIIDSIFQLVKGISIKNASSLFSKKVFTIYNRFLKGDNKYETVEREGTLELNNVPLYFGILKKEAYQKTNVEVKDITGNIKMESVLTTLKNEDNVLSAVFNGSQLSYQEVSKGITKADDIQTWVAANKNRVIEAKGTPVFKPKLDSNGKFIIGANNKLEFEPVKEESKLDEEIPF